MAGKNGKNGSERRIAAGRALLTSKADADKIVVLANAPKPIKDAVAAECKEKDKAEKAVAKEKTKYERLVQASKRVADKETGLEVAAGLAGHGWFEGLNYLIRMMAEWSKKTEGEDGFWASNVDWLQSTPGVLGLAIYVFEKMLRDDFNPEDKDLDPKDRRPYDVSTIRRGFSEAGKIAGHLGFSNTVRALRFRYAESVDEALEKNMVIKSKDRQLQDALDELEKAKAQLRSLGGGAAPGGGAAGGGGTGP